jgi:hypothetical protein
VSGVLLKVLDNRSIKAVIYPQSVTREVGSTPLVAGRLDGSQPVSTTSEKGIPHAYRISFDRRHFGRCRWGSIRRSASPPEGCRTAAFSLNWDGLASL